MEQYKYDAFISYRHLPFDKMVAEKLQVLFETYKPPKGIAASQTTRRVFRDQSELPTSGDLDSRIKEALRQSRFLIVVCSEETQNSKWCLKEIEYFKALYGGKCGNILTLLISGEPHKVFPDSLCKEIRETISLNGETILQEIEIEPLAANIVAATEHKSLRLLSSEFLRIAAPLLGCGYDDLYRRHQRRFRWRIVQISAVSFVAVILTSIYVIYNQNQIAETNKAADEQRNIAENQSIIRTLGVAENLIESGDKLLGSTLILEILDGISVPEEYLKQEIERLLGWSTYIPQFGGYAFLNHDELITCFDINNDILFSYTQNGMITLWNTANGELLNQINVSVPIAAMLYENDLLYTVTENQTIIIWNTETWEKEDEFTCYRGGYQYDFYSVHDMMIYNNVLYLAEPNSEYFINAIDLNTKTYIELYQDDAEYTDPFIQVFFDRENYIIYGNTGSFIGMHDLVADKIEYFPSSEELVSIFDLNDDINRYDNGMAPNKYRVDEESAVIAGAEENTIYLFSLKEAAIESQVSVLPEDVYGTNTRENGLDKIGRLDKAGDGLNISLEWSFKIEAVSCDDKYAIIEIETEEKPLYAANKRNHDFWVSYWIVECLTGERLYNANIPMDFIAIDIKDDTIATVLTNSYYIHDINMKTGEILSSVKLAAFSLSGDNSPHITKFRINYEKDKMLFAGLYWYKDNDSSWEDDMSELSWGGIWSKTSGEKLSIFSDTYNERYLGFDRTATYIYKYRLDDENIAYDILKIELPDYDRLVEIAREQVGGRTISENERNRLGLNEQTK